MPDRIVVVYHGRDFLRTLERALRADGFEVAAFDTAMAAATAVLDARKVDLFIAEARGKGPGLRISIAATPGVRNVASAVVLPLTAAIPDVLEAVRTLLSARPGWREVA